jgi:hypothetical protein
VHEDDGRAVVDPVEAMASSGFAIGDAKLSQPTRHLSTRRGESTA